MDFMLDIDTAYVGVQRADRIAISYQIQKGVVTTVSCPAGPSSCPPGAYAGFVTSAVETGASILKIQEGAGTRASMCSAATCGGSIFFKDHAGAAFL